MGTLVDPIQDANVDELLARFTAAVVGVEDMADSYTLYMNAGSFEAARDTSNVLKQLVLISFETICEIEAIFEVDEVEMTATYCASLDTLRDQLLVAQVRFSRVHAASA